MRHLFVVLFFCGTALAQTPPGITTQPARVSVSLGATATLRVSAGGTAPLRYQWSQDRAAILNATNATLTLANIQISQAGIYSVFVTNDFGSATSKDAAIEVDPAFIKIMTGAIVSDGGDSTSASWIDYDNDGDLDLFISNFDTPLNFLYQNNGDGTFARITTGPLATTHAQCEASVWADYDNDGDLDVFVSTFGNDFLFRNDTGGVFTRPTTGPVVASGGSSRGAAWGDYDNDGNVDLFVANEQSQKNFLFHNNGDGSFTRVTTGRVANDIGYSTACAWADYDNDGDLDLYVSNRGQASFLYRNDGPLGFARVAADPVVQAVGASHGAAWADYDNDGFLDLFVANQSGQKNFLFHNNGNGTFTRVTTGAIANDVAEGWGCAWGDYDNDGWIDLFVANGNVNNTAINDFLYHNNGDGTFQKITSGSLVNDGELGDSCAWGDYNGDGFLDLFVSNFNGQNNRLYRNSGNANHWLIVKCVGRISNRAAIGARVQVAATIGEKRLAQIREISGGSGYNGQNSLYAHFGLGSAARVERIVIRWPSGVIQELGEMAGDRLIVVKEPSRLRTVSTHDGNVDFLLESDRAARFQIETSENLLDWTPIQSNTPPGPFTLPLAGGAGFVRALEIP